MFKCQITNKTSKRLEKLNKVVVKTRPVSYKHYDHETEEEWVTHGTEIVQELNATEDGVKLWNSLTEEEREEFIKGLS